MSYWQEEVARWWAQSTDEQRLALAGTVRAWAREVGQEEFLDPLASRHMHKVLASELGDWARQQYGVELTADQSLLKSWWQLPQREQAPWVRVIGEQLESGSQGAEAARVVSLALAPPPFREMGAHEQVNLLRQIAGEIETYLEHDPRWYSSATPAHRDLAWSIRRLEDVTRAPQGEPCDIWWSHMSLSTRDGVLGDVARFARWAARGEEVPQPVRRELLDLARSAEQIIAPSRTVPMARE